ncbi:MAG: hypothetical protein WBG30_03620 [Psychrilyobacter sp.]|uniref:hypothetical protein n=1 Tax=Psychrilyobacter sp. TaxID=2586924 RepID=UPI003C749AA1
MEILKNIFKNEKKVDDSLEIKLKDEITCIDNLKSENFLKEYNIKESLSPIFETSELYKKLKEIDSREEAILFLEERKKIDYKEYTKIFISRTITTLKKKKYTKKDINFLIDQFEISNLLIPNFKKIRGKNKENLIRVLKEKLEIERDQMVKRSFEYNLQMWKLTHNK